MSILNDIHKMLKRSNIPYKHTHLSVISLRETFEFTDTDLTFTITHDYTDDSVDISIDAAPQEGDITIDCYPGRRFYNIQQVVSYLRLYTSIVKHSKLKQFLLYASPVLVQICTVCTVWLGESNLLIVLLYWGTSALLFGIHHHYYFTVPRMEAMLNRSRVKIQRLEQDLEIMQKL